jgi:flagellar hook assembly protein FlgD
MPTTSIEDNSSTVPATFVLKQNYPNPFNPSTTISFDLQEQTLINLVIYDVLGKQIKTLVNQPLNAGVNTAGWNGNDGSGRPVSSGVYLYRITAGESTQTRKMLLLR